MDKERFNHRVTVGILALMALLVVFDFTVGAQLFAGLLGLFQ